MNSPAYQGIKDFILSRIDAGVWAEGDQVPSENELAREFKVARMTVNRALRELTSEQVLTRVQGSGTFVTQGPTLRNSLDTNFSYTFDDLSIGDFALGQSEVFFNINNLFDIDPPTRPVLGYDDVIGRTFVAGLRIKM